MENKCVVCGNQFIVQKCYGHNYSPTVSKYEFINYRCDKHKIESLEKSSIYYKFENIDEK